MHTIKLIGLKTHNMTSLARQLGRFLGFERNLVLFLFLAGRAPRLPAMFSLVASSLAKEKHTMGIGIQSLTKRLPIIIGPIAGGLLMDRYGIVTGVRIGLGLSILLGGLSILLQS